MRRVHDTQRRLDALDITRIRLDVKSRDDIPAILIGLQDPCGDEGTRKRLSGLPGRLVLPGKNRRVGRQGMELWTIPVPGVVKQGPGCGFDRLRELAKPAHPDPAKAGGQATDHGTWTDTDTGGWLTACRSPRRSFPPRSEGRSWRGATGWPEKSPAPRCAAAVIPSWPGPTSTIRPTAACRWTRHGAWSGTCPGPAGGLGPRGWRRKEYLCGKLRKGYLRVATSRLANPRPGDVEAPLHLALKLADRAEAGRAEIDGMLGIPGPSDSIRGFIGHVRHRADLTGRRILKGGRSGTAGRCTRYPGRTPAGYRRERPGSRWSPASLSASLRVCSIS